MELRHSKLYTMSVKEVIEIATAASARDSDKRLETIRSGFVRCHAALIKKASSIPTQTMINGETLTMGL